VCRPSPLQRTQSAAGVAADNLPWALQPKHQSRAFGFAGFGSPVPRPLHRLHSTVAIARSSRGPHCAAVLRQSDRKSSKVLAPARHPQRRSDGSRSLALCGVVDRPASGFPLFRHSSGCRAAVTQSARALASLATNAPTNRPSIKTQTRQKRLLCMGGRTPISSSTGQGSLTPLAQPAPHLKAYSSLTGTRSWSSWQRAKDSIGLWWTRDDKRISKDQVMTRNGRSPNVAGMVDLIRQRYVTRGPRRSAPSRTR